MLVDRHQRIHDYLRISITDNCNFRCTYCMPDEDISFLKQKFLMTSDEIFNIAKVFTGLGVKKIRLTGGEPLMRKDFGEIISKLSILPVKIGITTNGLLIDRYLDDILAADISSVNISIDSLKKNRFQQITQRNHFDKVWQNILICIERGLHVKLNVVVIKDVNDDEVFDFVQLTKNLPIHVRFIEFMPFAKNHWDQSQVLSNQVILNSIKEKFPLFKLEDQSHDTGKKFGIFGHSGTISLISTLSDNFCANCNRIRITADGKIKNCLFGKDEFDIIDALRQNEDIQPIIEKAVFLKHKKLGGQFDDYKKINPEILENRSMIKIGG